MTFFKDFATAVTASRAVDAAASVTSGLGQQSAAAAGVPGARQSTGSAARYAPEEYIPQIRLLSEAGSHSLDKMIIESYIRNGVKVPSSLSQLLPKLQAVCPRVRRGGVGMGVLGSA